MHTAPTVDYPVGRSRFQMLGLFVIGFCLAAVDALWFSLAEVLDWRQWLGLAATLAAMAIALHAWLVAPSGVLHWDGGAWCWESEGVRVNGTLDIFLDVQGVMLLCFGAEAGRRRWFWTEQTAARTRWSALRRAAHAPVVSEDAGQAALPVEPPRRDAASRP